MTSPSAPPFNPTDIHIVLAFDDNFWAPAYAVMRSICLTTTRRADIVFHLCQDGLSHAHRADLDRIATEFGARLCYYALADNGSFNTVARALPVAKRLHAVIYARLLVDLILPAGIGRLIYLDCDTMVIGPIEQLWDADLGGRTLGAVPDAWKLLQTGGRDMTAKSGVFDTASPYFNSGVLVIDLEKFAAADVPGQIASLAQRGLIEKLYYDQDMLNLIFAGQWTPLPWRFNVIDPRPPHQAMLPVVLHYTGKRRPWNLISRTAFARLYRHVMTNELYYRFMRHRWKRAWGKFWRRLAGRP